MIKVLWYSDFLLPTGFGNVAEEIVTRLLKTGKYEFTVIAANYEGDPYNILSSPYYKFKDIPVYPARFERDVMGYTRIYELLRDGDFDIFFALQDPVHMVFMHQQLLSLKAIKGFSYIFYIPVDGNVKPVWINEAVGTADFPITYTNYGLNQIKKISQDIAKRTKIIYHGVDRNTFYPLDSKEKQEAKKYLFNAEPYDFVITNINRNSIRKDMARSIIAFLDIIKIIPHSKLYLNTNIYDPYGHDLKAFIDQYVPDKITQYILYPDPKKMRNITKEVLNSIYNASDVVISTTTGEGWGLSTTEAMACKIPVIMPDHTSLSEIVGENEERGWLAQCGDFTIFPYFSSSIMRPTTNIGSLVSCANEVHKNKKKVENIVNNAYDWIVENCDWDKIADQWNNIFDEAYLLSRSRKKSE